MAKIPSGAGTHRDLPVGEQRLSPSWLLSADRRPPTVARRLSTSGPSAPPLTPDPLSGLVHSLKVSRQSSSPPRVFLFASPVFAGLPSPFLRQVQVNEFSTMNIWLYVRVKKKVKGKVFRVSRMSSSDSLSNTLEKSTPSEEPIGTNIQTTQEAPQSQPQEPPTDTTTTNEGTTNSTSSVRKRKLASEVWNHFKIVEIKEKLKAECNYCKSKLLGDPKQGTSHLRDHFKSCKLRTTRDIRQCMMKTTPTTSGETVVVSAYTFDQENTRKELSVMVITRNTLKSDILKLYNDERSKTMNVLERNKSRIPITTDMWTASNQNKGYMVITAHYIDDSWKLQSRLIRFIYVPAPHTAEVLSKVLVDCLMDWNLDRKVSTLTVDNCNTNDVMIDNILTKTSHRNFILGGKLFHMRCCAHILNLIVKDGLQLISHAIERVRDSVHYWTATPKREEKFKETCAQVKISYTKNLCLDCKTRWNSTFFMLEVAIMYRDVFERLSLRESQYKSLPSEKDWDMADEIFQRLRIFFDVTELFSGTTYPTSNLYFPKVCVIKLALMEWKHCENEIIEMMATSMITKFEKYWGVINTVMAIGTLLDPRYKMYLLNFFFRKIYGETEACVVIGQVKRVVQDLVLEYATKGRERDQAAQLDIPPPPSIPLSSKGRKFSHEDWQADFAAHVSEESAFIDTKSELDYYLEERPVPQNEHDFDILNWWKSNGAKFPTLQAIARDFLAIPISTVASESSFSTGGRFVTPHRSRLRPDTLEALMCNQDWLWNEFGTTTNIGFE
ncbi:zinc finger BED domain-containing protein RICESLEEPER 2-like [Arachis hypogaea]|uniref:zinc finger BED domain-containing protein RICESLEEPER 2-like n=1 Tax=Arachis hypogaea TaxID=3818 RepID=UPI003B225909